MVKIYIFLSGFKLVDVPQLFFVTDVTGIRFDTSQRYSNISELHHRKCASNTANILMRLCQVVTLTGEDEKLKSSLFC